MNNIRIIEHEAPAIGHNSGQAAVTTPFKVDVSRGTNRGDVSRQWASRPDDERYLSLDALFEATNRRRMASVEATMTTQEIRVRGSQTDPHAMAVLMPDEQAFAPSHYAFGQMCQLAKMGRATDIFRSQPSWLAGMNLQFGLTRMREAPTKVYADTESGLLRAATGPDYGRIYDATLVEAIQKFAGNGTGDTCWKVPGMINWGTMTYNPWVDITKQTTTLFASDRDVFVFLVDDTNPIQIGTLKNGDPDLVFRGFYAWNSEVGTRSLGIATFFLRGVCQNRTLWGVENFDELRIVHSKYGGDRFARDAEPALRRYAASEPTALLAGINEAKATDIRVDNDEDRLKFLTAESLGFSKTMAEQIMATFEREEDGRINTVWDAVTGITAVARTIANQDTRIEMEKTASKLMDRATRKRSLVDA